jgi:GTP-binding protein
MLTISNAEFVKSSVDVQHCPSRELPEFAFIGRSNVGKSSLINMLVQRRKLAKTSGKPGKTQTINHFIINEGKPRPWYLVDLPGYGYAKTAKSDRKEWQKFITNYLEQRAHLICTMVLIDSRHEPQKIDLEFIEYLGLGGIPFACVFTKSDKMKPLALTRSLDLYKATLLETFVTLPPFFVTSAEHSTGRAEVLEFIQTYLPK